MNEKTKELRERIEKRITPAQRNFVRKNLDISDRIVELLNGKGISQKELAERIGKSEDEVADHLTGLYDLDLRTITLIETALGEDVIITPLKTEKKLPLQDD